VAADDAGDLGRAADVVRLANAETVDGNARVLLPGLIDSHVHIHTRSDLE